MHAIYFHEQSHNLPELKRPTFIGLQKWVSRKTRKKINLIEYFGFPRHMNEYDGHMAEHLELYCNVNTGVEL